ncbi:putative N-acetyltransferase [Selenomonas ruminantium subsp. lactilytica TAM6421]|uniref:Putative N-acetyltransferase n=1 Tax=Selenomonas ruminantium subsp. lactilytica (strain NBRC 103574 / TAM6421) TaxID=927704 RepID=I0GU47_SELRL|nr:GNAT family protein [Selenomonas ruminantium]BAL84284.1 putative N-acetyltransferase [Selenomonas ruminantium subsp. lactilytica TAM6421]
MAEILITGPRLRLRRADTADLDYIIDLEYAEDNLPFIVPFDRAFHENIMTKGEASMDVIIEETATGEKVGYFMVAGLKTEAKEMEWTHVIVGKKGLGYGHEAMKLIKKWCFEVKKFHRAWLDCKDYNERALHLYESEGMVREGLIRETIVTNGVYENLVILGILDREYTARQEAGLEL